MTADEVRAALRRRHPAVTLNPTAPGAWTTIDNFVGGGEIDLLALSAWQNPPPIPRSKLHPYPRVGYEIKVSRSDLRSELLNPAKRAGAVRFCNRFYLAVPDTLLTVEEMLWDEPAWMSDPASWQRTPCTETCYRPGRRRGSGESRVYDKTLGEFVVCPTCGGKGHLGASRVEAEAPTLWVPPDLGLVTVSPAGRCKVVREAPPRAVEPLSPIALGTLARWISVRPDPRHVELRGSLEPDTAVPSAA